MPDGLHVVQVGDVVRLVDNETWMVENLQCVKTVNLFMRENPDRWIQLWGNHDVAALGGLRKHNWDLNPCEETVTVLREWWDDRRAVFAVSVGGAFVSHAGLTFQMWKKVGPAYQSDIAADKVNDWMFQEAKKEEGIAALGHGEITEKFSRSRWGDVLWAHPARELIPGWESAPSGCYFDQIYGHARVTLKEFPRKDAVSGKVELSFIEPKRFASPITVGSSNLIESVSIAALEGMPHKLMCVDTGLVHNGDVLPPMTMKRPPN